MDPTGPLDRVQVKIDAERNGYAVEILRPMRCVAGNVHGRTGMQVEYLRSGLPLRFVSSGADVAAVVTLQFFGRDQRPIAGIEDAQALVAVNLVEKVGVGVDVIRGDGPRGGDQQRCARSLYVGSQYRPHGDDHLLHELPQHGPDAHATLDVTKNDERVVGCDLMYRVTDSLRRRHPGSPGI